LSGEEQDRPGLAARRVAARLLGAIIDRRTLADGLLDDEGGHPQFLALDPRDRALVRAILSAALRHRVAIGRLIGARLDRPLPVNARALEHILHVALAQILFLDVPGRAAVDLAVEHAGRDPRARRFAGLVNAVLRAILRQPEARLQEVVETAVEAPDWFAARLRDAYGEDKALAILAAHRLPPPFDFTVRSDPELWAERLGGIVLPTGSVRVGRLDGPVSGLPGYAEGRWWIQDAAAALPARLLGGVAGLSVADLCAAPGGKTAQLAAAGAEVTALDLSASRMKRLAANLERLGLSARLVVADLLDFEPEQPFDAVLLDAPCSATGTLRRHPDIPWTKTPGDIARLAGLQRRMIERAFRLVRPGGLVVYANCSLDPSEGEDLLRSLDLPGLGAAAAPVAPGEFESLAPFISGDGHLRTTPADLALDRPGMSGLDGFFAARFRRLAP
jgi:16S rRNA (cytosine967-C5)-methyltransferase